MKERKKVLYISQEIAPYLPESPMAVVGRDLPQSTQEMGYEVRTFMPKFGCINERRNQLHEVIRLSGMNIVIDDTDHPLIIKVATLQPSRMQVYFIDNDDYFQFSPDKRLEIVSSPNDNDERIMFFARGVIETARKLRWNPAIIHCMGWTSALVPLFLRKLYPEDPTFANSKIVYALRNEDFKDTLDSRFVEKMKMYDLDDNDLSAIINSDVDFIALNKLAIDYADAIVQSSQDVDPVLLDYAKSTDKPFMSYNSDKDQSTEDYRIFYENLIKESE